VHLTEVAAELGIDLADCGIKSLHSFGEPGAAVEATKTTMNERFGQPTIIDGYGLSEVWPLGGNCPFSDALKIAEDFAAVECVDPDTGELVPEGQPGEIVFTNLIGDTHPLLRYRSGDIGRLIRSEPCECGSTFVRIERIEGRADDMLWYRGVNFFPSAVEEIVRRRPELSPEYRIVVNEQGGGGLSQVSIQVEAQDAGDAGVVAERLRGELRGGLGVAPQVEVLPMGALPRGEGGKTKRVLVRSEGGT
jgi:phenylacetate-CoA ligase